MNFLSKKASGIAPYTAGEQPQDRKYIKLNTNENPYPPSPRVAEVLRALETEGLRRYPRPDAGKLRAAIALEEGVEPENVFCGNGSDEVLALSFPAFFDADGAGACFADLTYSFYEVFAAFFGIPVNIVPLRADFTFDLSAMKEVRCQGYYIANPNAPTGVGIERDLLDDFVASVPDRLVILDEAYMDFFGESCVPLTKKYSNVIVVKTFSKSYALAGIRCGYAVGNAALIDGLFRMKDCFNSYPVDAVAEAVCAAAIADREYYRGMTARVVSERERLRGELLGMGFTVPESRSNFLFAGRTKLSGREIYARLKAAGILVCYWEKPVLCDFVRITVGTPEENDVLLSQLYTILS